MTHAHSATHDHVRSWATRVQTYSLPTHDQAGSTVAGWTISGVGIVRILYGGIVVLALARGFEAGTGYATAALATIGVWFVIQGIVTTALAGVLTNSYTAVTISVALDALGTILGIMVMVAGWNQLTAAAGTVVLGAVAVAALSAVVVAMTPALSTSTPS